MQKCKCGVWVVLGNSCINCSCFSSDQPLDEELDSKAEDQGKEENELLEEED